MSEPELSPEQLIEAIKRMKVSDLLLSTVTTLAQLGYAKLDDDTRDLDQARLAIDSLRALVPMLDQHVGPDAMRDLNAMVANLQLSYADAARSTQTEGQ